jgi:hypothetical protein
MHLLGITPKPSSVTPIWQPQHQDIACRSEIFCIRYVYGYFISLAGILHSSSADYVFHPVLSSCSKGLYVRQVFLCYDSIFLL